MKLGRVKRLVVLVAAVSVVAAVGACSEEFSGGAACPVLCPESEFDIVDTLLLDPVAFDTTLRGYPLPGTEGRLTLLQRFGNGDTAITAAIVRFDVVPKTIPVGRDAAHVAKVDAAMMRLA